MSEEVKNEVVLEGKMAEFVDWVETISVLELSQLVTALEDRLGVTAAAPAAVAVAAPTPSCRTVADTRRSPLSREYLRLVRLR